MTRRICTTSVVLCGTDPCTCPAREPDILPEDEEHLDSEPEDVGLIGVAYHKRVARSRRAWIDAGTSTLPEDWNGTPDDLRAALAAKDEEMARLKADMARISEEWGLPPTLVPADGEFRRVRESFASTQRELIEWKAALQAVVDVIDPNGDHYFWRKKKEQVADTVKWLHDAKEKSDEDFADLFHAVTQVRDHETQPRVAWSVVTDSKRDALLTELDAVIARFRKPG